MNQTDQTRKGLEATFSELLWCRPNRKFGGFAPSGKVDTHQHGANRSIFLGRGMEVDEVRAYQPGDDIRAIDWRVTARTGAMHTKLFHEERARPVFILSDLRSNMQFGSRRQFKSVLAAGIGARLAWTAVDGGDRVGGFLSTPLGIRNFPARGSMSSALEFLKAMAKATELNSEHQDEAPLHKTIDRLRQVSRPGTLVFIISDFVDFDEQTERAIRRLALHAHVTNIMIYDPLEASLPVQDGLRISDGSAVSSIGSIGKNVLLDHSRQFADRRERIETMCRKRGMAFHAVATHQDADDVLRPRRLAPVPDRTRTRKSL